MKIKITRDTFGPEGKLFSTGEVHDLKDTDAVYLVNRGKAKPLTEEEEAAGKSAKKAAKKAASEGGNTPGDDA